MKKIWNTLSGTQVALVIILALVVINLVASVAFFRLDLTKNGLFTISEPTKNLVKNLDDLVTIKVYFTDNLPAPYSTNRTYIADQLEELRSLSGGKLNYQIIDPTDNEEYVGQADQYQIPALQVQVFEDERMEVKKAYMGLVILYEDQSETLPVLQQLDNFEFDLATTMNRMVNKKLPVLATSTDFGMPGWSDKQGLKRYLDKQYNLISISLESEIPDTVHSLMLFNPTDSISFTAQIVVKNFLKRGGKLAWFFDRMTVNPQYQTATPNNNGLDSLFAEFGLTVSDNLVQDLQCAAISVPQNIGMFTINNQVEFPYLPVISDIDQESPVARGVNVVTPIFASEISINPVSDSLFIRPLLNTSSRSKSISGYFPLDPFQKWEEAMFNEKALPVAVTAEGKFGSTDKTGRLLLMTDAEFMTDQYIQNGANVPFILNVIYWISPDDGFLGIPTKRDFMVPLPEMEAGIKQIIKYSNLIIPPVLVLVWGITRWRRRKLLAES